MNLTPDTLISGSMDYLFILIFSLLGAVVTDTYNTLTEKDTKVNISRILISTIVSSIIIFSFSDFFLAKVNWKEFVFLCFIGGTVGFELFGKIRNLQFWIDFYNRFRGGGD